MPCCIRSDAGAQYLIGPWTLRSGEHHHQRMAGHPIDMQVVRREARREDGFHTTDVLCTDRSVFPIPLPLLQSANAARVFFYDTGSITRSN